MINMGSESELIRKWKAILEWSDSNLPPVKKSEERFYAELLESVEKILPRRDLHDFEGIRKKRF